MTSVITDHAEQLWSYKKSLGIHRGMLTKDVVVVEDDH
jgi:hypothetical protein